MQKKDVFWLVFLKNKLRRYRLAGLLSVCMLCLSTIEAAAQQRITMNLGETTLRAFFQELQKESGRAVLYNDDRLDLDRKVTVNERDVTMEELLTKVLKGSGMTYQLLGNEILILPAPPEKEEPRHTTVKGRVVDETGQPVPGATIVLKGSTLGTSADSEGRFTLSVPQGKEIVLRISFVGMRTEEAVYRQSAEGEEWRVVMRAEDTELNEVTVVSTG